MSKKLELDHLNIPPADVRRWTVQRKTAVVLAITKKALSVRDACEQYNLSAQELAELIRKFSLLAQDHRPAIVANIQDLTPQM